MWVIWISWCEGSYLHNIHTEEGKHFTLIGKSKLFCEHIISHNDQNVILLSLEYVKSHKKTWNKCNISKFTFYHTIVLMSLLCLLHLFHQKMISIVKCAWKITCAIVSYLIWCALPPASSQSFKLDSPSRWNLNNSYSFKHYACVRSSINSTC